MTTEGIPDGWELVRVGQCNPGETKLSKAGEPLTLSCGSDDLNCVIIRKIEKPKQYRPFANAAEFEPHRDRWVKYRGDDCGGLRVIYYDNTQARIDDDLNYWDRHFIDYTFDDGTPFGIEVTE